MTFRLWRCFYLFLSSTMRLPLSFMRTHCSVHHSMHLVASYYSKQICIVLNCVFVDALFSLMAGHHCNTFDTSTSIISRIIFFNWVPSNLFIFGGIWNCLLFLVKKLNGALTTSFRENIQPFATFFYTCWMTKRGRCT